MRNSIFLYTVAALLFALAARAELVGFSASAPGTVSEGDGSVDLIITMDHARQFPVRVELFLGGSADSPEDYIMRRHAVIPPGKTSVTLPIKIVDDDEFEGDETIEISYEASSRAMESSGVPSNTIVIQDNDFGE